MRVYRRYLGLNIWDYQYKWEHPNAALNIYYQTVLIRMIFHIPLFTYSKFEN